MTAPTKYMPLCFHLRETGVTFGIAALDEVNRWPSSYAAQRTMTLTTNYNQGGLGPPVIIGFRDTIPY
jgi:hypothetical protein